MNEHNKFIYKSFSLYSKYNLTINIIIQPTKICKFQNVLKSSFEKKFNIIQILFFKKLFQICDTDIYLLKTTIEF